MNRLYLRIVIGVLTILVLSFFMPELLGHLFSERPGPNGPPNPMRGSVELIKRYLEQVPIDKIDLAIDSLSQLTQHEIRLVNPGDSALPPDFSQTEEDNFRRGEKGFDNPPASYTYLGKFDKVLIVKPNFAKYRPDTKYLIVLIALTLIIVSFASFIVIAPIIKNLRSLETAAVHFGKGELDSRARIKSRDAVGSVAKQFNLMADKTQALITQERQLLQAVSHELKTPIARVRFILDKITNAKTKDEQITSIQDLDGEISEMDILVNELLNYNQLSNTAPLNKQQFSVRETIEEIYRRLADVGTEKAKRLSYIAESEILVLADREAFKRVLQNLLLNALRFADSQIVVKCYQETDSVIVEVCDDGPGIPEFERERIFKPFARLENSRSRESGGVGLGLAIVQRIIEKHNGSITVGDADIGGAKFITKWPNSAAVS